ncbi:MAG: glycosyltransferase [Lachnospiraceae bacterium]|nr:glycosyltransferase [Lachnospiraceae bacterium]
MRVIQMLPTLAYGDAIGNDTLTLGDTLEANGYDTKIYAGFIDERIHNPLVVPAEEYECREDDVIIYHLSTGSDMNYELSEYNCKKIIMYHNVTPPEFFEFYDKNMEDICASGLRATKYLRTKADFCFADSEFNKQELIEMGYTCDIEVLPILIAFDDYKKAPSAKVLKEYEDDDYVNIVFTGRVAPNKKQEDLIAAFAYYKKNINPKSRLILVGNHLMTPGYYPKLSRYIERLGVEDVVFTGHIRFDEILAYYKIADVFLCLSEHEGFCVPLVEAMFFDVPVIAYDSCAVGETLGGAGLLLPTKESRVVGEAINLIVENKEFQKQLIAGQRERLKAFRHDVIKAQFLKAIQAFTEGDMK